MFKKDHLETPPDKVNTVIGKDTHFKGSIRTKGLIRIDGEMEGDVHTQGDAVIGESGRVALDLKARNVAVAGRFEGTMEAEGKLEIRSSGIVIGNVKTNSLLVDDGAVFSGNIEMKRKDQVVKSVLKNETNQKSEAKEASK
ncbi:MAG: polymer-forming cytoskeletal protein [Bacillota bacterium]